MAIDDRLKAAASELRDKPAGPVPELRRSESRLGAAGTWALVAILVGGGIWAISSRPGDNNSSAPAGPESSVAGPLGSVEDEPITSVSEIGTVAEPLDTAVAPSIEETQPSATAPPSSELTCDPGASVSEPETWMLAQMRVDAATLADGSIALVIVDELNGEETTVSCMSPDVASASLANNLSVGYVARVGDGVAVALLVPSGQEPRLGPPLEQVGLVRDSAGFDIYLFRGDGMVDLAQYGVAAAQLGSLVNSAWQDGTVSVTGLGPDLLTEP